MDLPVVEQPTSPTMMPWRQPEPCADIAAELRDLRAQCLGRLLTEETVRFATVKTLARLSVEPDAMRYEWSHPALRGSRIDLVVGIPPTMLVELKYPREPNETNVALTMTYGEVLKDFYWLATYPPSPDRVFVYRYMTGAASRYGLAVNATEITRTVVDGGQPCFRADADNVCAKAPARHSYSQSATPG